MSPEIRLGPHVELPTDVTWISVIAKSDWFWTRSLPLLSLELLHPAIAIEPSAATTQPIIRRFCMARTSSNDRAVGADCRTHSCTAVESPNRGECARPQRVAVQGQGRLPPDHAAGVMEMRCTDAGMRSASAPGPCRATAPGRRRAGAARWC